MNILEKQEWESLLKTYRFRSEKAKKMLENKPLEIKGRTPREIIRRFDDWAAKKKHPGTIKEEAAKCMWGMSSAFDDREDIVKEFGLRSAPVQVMVYMMGETSDTAIFVDSYDVFTSLIDAHDPFFLGKALVHIPELSEHIRTKTGSAIMYHELSMSSTDEKRKFGKWFRKESEITREVFFWGDMSYEGAEKAEKFKKIFPEAKLWSPGYRMMKYLQKSKNGYIPEEGVCIPPNTDMSAKIQKTINESGFCVDQETVDITKL